MNGSELVKNNPKIVLFDGVCSLCAVWMHFVIQRDPDSRIKLASVQSIEGQALLAWCGLPVNQYDTMVYIEDGQAFAYGKKFWRTYLH